MRLVMSKEGVPMLVIVALASATLLLASCGGSPAPTGVASPTLKPSQPATTASATGQTAIPVEEEPRYGGTLVMAMDDDPPDMDPLTATNINFFAPFSNVYDGLLKYDYKDTSKVIPDLAKSWTISPDGKTYTFSLQQGVKFHNGYPFTSEDAKFSIEMLRKSAFNSQYLANVASAEAPDPATLKIVLSRPQVSFLNVLALFTMNMLSKKVYEEKGGNLKQTAIGTGPFKFKTYQRGVSIEFERNPDYFMKGLPYLDGLTVLILRDRNTLIGALRTGRVHVTRTGRSALTGSEAATLKEQVPGFQAPSWEQLSVYMLYVNVDKKPWDDVRVRQAASLALDRWAAVDLLGDGLGKPALAVVSPEWRLPEAELLKMPGMAKGADKAKEREQAKRLLAEAGYPGGFNTDILTLAGWTKQENITVYTIEQLKTIGITVKSVPVEPASLQKNRTEGTTALISMGGNMAYPDPDAMWRNINPDRLMSTLKDDEMIALYEKQSLESDPAKRKQVVYDLQRRMATQLNQIVISTEETAQAARPEVRNWYTPVGTWSGGKIDHVWLAK